MPRCGDSFEFFFLAMCEWQLGNEEKARQWYNKPTGGVSNAPGRFDSDTLPLTALAAKTPCFSRGSAADTGMSLP
ncbi:MAG TPA: hypothetical protein VFA26_22145, partial [Gemmataceae bacterium]|nr:hypothetical protein [Gemmataceae bacterium]